MYDKESEEWKLANRIAQLREKRRISARDMSLSIGQNPGYVNNIETGRAMPSMTNFFYICEFFGIEPKEFFDYDTENPGELRDVMEKMKHLGDEELAALGLLADRLAYNNGGDGGGNGGGGR